VAQSYSFGGVSVSVRSSLGQRRETDLADAIIANTGLEDVVDEQRRSSDRVVGH
jgi:hypothetical protein